MKTQGIIVQIVQECQIHYLQQYKFDKMTKLDSISYK